MSMSNPFTTFCSYVAAFLALLAFTVHAVNVGDLTNPAVNYFIASLHCGVVVSAVSAAVSVLFSKA